MVDSHCGIVLLYIDNYFKVLDFIEWLKEYYPEKATFLTNKF